MADLLDILGRERKSKTKQIKIIQHSEDYSEAYNKVIFEKYAPHENNEKCTFNFQDSLDKLIQRGYVRHPRPNEAFGLLCAYLEGDLSIKNIAKDMLNSYGEWFSLAMKYQNNILHCYIDPSFEVVKQNGVWHYSLISCSSEKLFSLLFSDNQFFSIKETNALNPSLVEFLWSRSFDKLPLEICNNAYLYLSNDEHIWPAGRGDYWYVVIGCECVGRASHGVKNAK